MFTLQEIDFLNAADSEVIPPVNSRSQSCQEINVVEGHQTKVCVIATQSRLQSAEEA